jgi:hypothetical protein
MYIDTLYLPRALIGPGDIVISENMPSTLKKMRTLGEKN